MPNRNTAKDLGLADLEPAFDGIAAALRGHPPELHAWAGEAKFTWAVELALPMAAPRASIEFTFSSSPPGDRAKYPTSCGSERGRSGRGTP